MKKRLIVLLMAALVVLAVPAMAFAADNASPVAGKDTVTVAAKSSDGSEVKLDVSIPDANITVTPTDTECKAAASVPASTIKSKASFDIESTDKATSAKVTLVYTVDASNAGLTCRIFVEHDDGTTESTAVAVANDGTVKYEMGKLSTVTFVLTNVKYDNGTTDNNTNTNTNTNVADNTTADNTAASTATKAASKAVAKDTSSSSPKTGVVL